MQSGNTRERQSSIELLRMVAMLMIVVHHFSEHSGFDWPHEVISWNRIWLQWLNVGGKIGVNVFILITGYFLSAAESIQSKKVIRLWLQIFFYSMGIFLVLLALHIKSFTRESLIQSLFPIASGRWWFASAYFVLYLLSPFVNRLLRTMERSAYKKYLMLLTVLWCLIPTISRSDMESNNLLWFIYLYSLAGYLRRFDTLRDFSASRCLLIFFGVTFLTFLSSVVFDLIGLRHPYYSSHNNYFFYQNSLPVLLASVFLFLGFLRLHIGYHGWINRIAAAVFGVYLIHDQEDIRNLLWRTLVPGVSLQDTPLLIPCSLLAPLAVFMGCIMIELLRRYIIERPALGRIEQLGTRIDRMLRAK